jgi:hypothetical protein
MRCLLCGEPDAEPVPVKLHYFHRDGDDMRGETTAPLCFECAKNYRDCPEGWGTPYFKAKNEPF